MPDLIPLYRELAAKDSNNFQGLSILQHKERIQKLAREVRAKSMLDYGCGRGDAYRSPHKLHHQLGIERANVALYDPAFRRDDVLPTGKFDLVLCSDVLEHVPEDQVDEVIARLFSYARYAVWASVCCRPAKKTFPDGTNMHVTVQPYEWWRRKFQTWADATNIRFELTETP